MKAKVDLREMSGGSGDLDPNYTASAAEAGGAHANWPHLIASDAIRRSEGSGGDSNGGCGGERERGRRREDDSKCLFCCLS